MSVTINGSTGVTFPNSTLQSTAAPGGGTTTTSAVDITLTATSTQVQYVSMTAADKFVILPNATTLGKGASVFTIVNNGVFPFHIKNSAGNIIYYNVSQQGTLNLDLVENSTASGVWANDNGLLKLSVGLPQISSISPYYSSFTEPTVAMLSSTQALIFYYPTSTTMSVVLATISGTSVSYGTPVGVVTSGSGTVFIPKTLVFNSTTAIICYHDDVANSGYMRAVTVSGSTVTVGSAVTFVAGPALFAYTGQMAKLDTSTGIIGYGTDSNTTLVRAFTVSGTTITLGGATSVSNRNEFYSIAQLDTNKVLCFYRESTGRKLRVITNSGTTLSLGTEYSIVSSAVVETSNQSGLVKLGTNLVSGTSYGQGQGNSTVAVSVSGTTVQTPVVTQQTAYAENQKYTVRPVYLSEGLQLTYKSTDYWGAWISLDAGNSSSGATSVAVQKLGIFINLLSEFGQSSIGATGGNKGIVVGVSNPFFGGTGGFLASQIIEVI